MATVATAKFDSDGRPYRPVLGEDSSGNKYVLITNSSGQLEIVLVSGTAAIGLVGHNITGLADGVKTVSTVGTDEALAASTPAKLVIVQAQTDNTGLIAVGNAGVDATEATGTGIILYAGDSVPIPCDNLNDIYIDATVATDGVRFTYFT